MARSENHGAGMDIFIAGAFVLITSAFSGANGAVTALGVGALVLDTSAVPGGSGVVTGLITRLVGFLRNRIPSSAACLAAPYTVRANASRPGCVVAPMGGVLALGSRPCVTW